MSTTYFSYSLMNTNYDKHRKVDTICTMSIFQQLYYPITVCYVYHTNLTTVVPNSPRPVKPRRYLKCAVMSTKV